jgi:hypothetical protein
VLQLPPIAQWLQLFDCNRAAALQVEFSPDMRRLVKQFYFRRYLQHFHSASNESYATALTSIPSVSMWDDHDIFDGYGSYDDEVQVCHSSCARALQYASQQLTNERAQACEVMRGIFACAREMFCLFQLHMTCDERAILGYFGGSCSLSTILPANDVAVVVLDLRSERTRSQFSSATTYSELKTRMLKLNCHHMLCVISIPILYPPLNTMHKVIDSMNPKDKNKFFAFHLKLLNKSLKQ